VLEDFLREDGFLKSSQKIAIKVGHQHRLTGLANPHLFIDYRCADGKKLANQEATLAPFNRS
jgi:hypothetical protein